MRILMQPIEMIAWFSEDKHPIPLRYRIDSEDDDKLVIKIDRILYSQDEKLVGNKIISYRCEGLINNLDKIFEIKYDISSCKWYLFGLE